MASTRLLMRMGALITGVGLLAAMGFTGLGCVMPRDADRASSAAAPEAEAAVADGTAINGAWATLVVFGMSCPLCANNVDKQLLAVRGVTEVKVDMGTGQVRVGLDPAAGVTREQLAAAVDRSGFTLNKLSVP